MQSDVYEELWRPRCIAQMPERERLIIQVGTLFGRELLADSPLDDLRQPLAALHKQCNKRVWGLCKNELCYDISKVMQHPPDELFATISVDALLQQYNRLRLWL